jgi:hypothetical protein
MLIDPGSVFGVKVPYSSVSVQCEGREHLMQGYGKRTNIVIVNKSAVVTY